MEGSNNSNQMFQIFLQRLFSGLNANFDNTSLIDRVMERSFNEEKSTIKRAKKEFIDSLNIKENTEDGVFCSICMEEVKKGEKIVELPCNESSYFLPNTKYVEEYLNS